MPAQQLTRPFGHFRLTAFFVIVAAIGVAFGAFRAHAHSGAFTASDVAWIAGTSVLLAVAIGFAGVFFHRLRINPVRWKETENYLVAIRRESTKYRALMEGAADMILVVEPVSRRVREASRRSREEFALGEAGTTVIDALVSENDRERIRAGLSRADASRGESVSIEDVRLRTSSGAARIADARLAAVDVDGERLVQVALRDVTAQKELERTLVVHERLSSIGLLTAGVAHEINNPLEGIGNYLKLLEKQDLAPDARERYLVSVRHGFARIGEIVRDLLHFARPEAQDAASEPRDFDLATAVERAVKLARYSSKLRGVTIETVGFDAPLFVRGDAGRIEQVVVNLLFNAGSAMDGSGRIVLSAGRNESEELVVTVDDVGPGIAPADLARIFDPFFTKTDGTGLGLFVSYGIVSAHGGRIWAENRAGGGARFTLLFPSLPRRAIET
ncbi:MAG: ATP-binding protein [Planctomycetota bacterium]|nr:ATP-binding protein [Planctomycetota bacterium]